MKISFFICMMISFFFACTPKGKIIPKDVLPVDSMKIIIWHLMQAGEYASYKKEKDSTIKLLNTVYFAEVLKLHHLDKNTFVKSFDFYQSNTYFNDILFDSVSAYANRQRNEVYKLKYDNPVSLSDSIKKIKLKKF